MLYTITQLNNINTCLTMITLSPIQPVTLREQIAAQIRNAIIEGKLRPNDHITESTLTERLGVSRTPLREAFVLLEREGLLRVERHKGCFVRAFNTQDVREIFSMRTTLENFAAELIINTLGEEDFRQLSALITAHDKSIAQGDFKTSHQSDMAFHRYFIQRSDHHLLLQNWTSIVAQIATLLYLRAEHFPHYQETLAVEDHQAILQAYQNQDLLAVQNLNRRINLRVEGECVQAVSLFAQETNS